MTDSAKAVTHKPLNSEPASLADSDYDSILRAVMETARGRWFLHEYVRRNRNADTSTLLAAIDRIESLLKSRDGEGAPEMPAAATPPDIAGIVVQLRDIAENLIECGAPIHLCNDLLRTIDDLARELSPRDEGHVAGSKPAAISIGGVAVIEPRRAPFADIMALSPEERIALFT